MKRLQTYVKYGVKKASASTTSKPVNMPPAGVLTPLVALTAVLEKDPVMGMDCTNDPTRLHKPSANISCKGGSIVSSIYLNITNQYNKKGAQNIFSYISTKKGRR